jgi:hypothetical protein
MRVRDRLSVLLSLLIAGCVSANTSSVVSSGDIPQSKYHKIIVFVENIDDSERLGAEQTVASALESKGVISQSSLVAFNYSRIRYSADEKAILLRKQNFDAILYVTMIQKALILEPVSDVSWDGEMFHGSAGGLNWASSLSASYIVTAEGRVVRPVATVVTRSELQDVMSAKSVWAADTAASVNGKYTSMPSLFARVAKEIVAKIREDHAI